MSTPTPVPTVDVYQAMMSFPYEQWLDAPAAAERVEEAGLPRDTLRLVIRTGRRRGLLRVKREPHRLGFFVMRVAERPQRRPHSAE